MRSLLLAAVLCVACVNEKPKGEIEPTPPPPITPGTVPVDAPEVTQKPPIRAPVAPQRRTYAAGTILPSVGEAALDAAVRDFYFAWKKRYLVEGCGPGRVYATVAVDGLDDGGGKSGRSITVSELHGYAMMIMPLIADRDPDARRLFDGLYLYFRDFPTTQSPDLMSFNQIEGCKNTTRDPTSATDADLDIAYALLLAADRWGSDGPINYADEARKVIAAVKAFETDPVTHLVLLGDFVKPGEGKHGQATRPSDFMIDHFRAYARATGDYYWTDAVDAHWALVKHVQDKYAPTTGLMPDFVIDTRTDDPRPPDGKVLEYINDGFYAWNACRVPWRLGTDWIASGDPRAREALRKMTSWIRTRTGDDPYKIDGGYRLDGEGITPHIVNETGFVAPFGVAAMSDPENQVWLDRIWARVVATPVEKDNYYGNSIKMLTMIVMSGRWIIL